MKTKVILLILLSINCFSQQIVLKNIEQSILNNFIDNKVKVLKALQFDDKNGKNYLTVTIQEDRTDDDVSKTLLVQHRIQKSQGEYELIRQIIDYETKCEFDNELNFIDKSLVISDLDKNKYAEITFLYKIGCRSDVSPVGLKLMVIENGNKAAIRGNTIPSGFESMKEKTSDAAFKKLPKVIQDQANRLWNKFAPEF
ncbi:hypothetical protein EMA8858_01478 [Emticicia aquatica]|uniref:Uncharacterized protein n=1 Tax=Emticicia aquatica TaxID=1681835 RepID=A0ABM9ANE0_9BACT|nr:hypothetical protein [Emticicia aquatica]CAH0995357.1 hypothetical protein EMA8858_01478 [Emticicia aquatica]